MNLSQAKINTPCAIKSIKIKDENFKIRLMELGLVVGTQIMVKHKSLLKKTLLVFFPNSCFTLKENIAKEIDVVYD